MRLKIYFLILLIGGSKFLLGQSNNLVDNLSWDDLVHVVDSYQLKKLYVESLPYVIRMQTWGKERYHKKEFRYARILHTVVQTTEEVGDWERSKAIRTELLNLAKRIFSDKSVDYANALVRLADVEMHLGNYIESEALCWQAKNVKLKNPLNQRYYSLQFFNRSIDQVGDKEKRRQVHKIYLDVKMICIRNLMTLASNYRKMGDYQAYELTNQSALEETTKVIRYLLKHSNKSISDDVVKEMKQLFQVFENFENYQNGEKLYLSTLELTRQSDLYEPLALNLALIYIKIGEYTGAKMIYAKLLQQAEKKYGTESLAFARVLENLAGFYMLIEDSSKAAKLYQKAKGIVLRLEGRDSKTYIKLNKKLKNVYRVSQQRNE